ADLVRGGRSRRAVLLAAARAGTRRRRRVPRRTGRRAPRTFASDGAQPPDERRPARTLSFRRARLERNRGLDGAARRSCHPYVLGGLLRPRSERARLRAARRANGRRKTLRNRRVPGAVLRGVADSRLARGRADCLHLERTPLLRLPPGTAAREGGADWRGSRRALSRLQLV